MNLKVVIEESGNGFHAYVPALYGCVYQGVSIEDVKIGITKAAKEYIENLPDEEIDRIKNIKSIIIDIEV